MMNNRKVYLIQASNDDELFIVDKLINTTTPALGSVLKPAQVQRLIQDRQSQVILTRAKAK